MSFKKQIYVLVFILFQPIFSLAEDNVLLDRDIQETLCVLKTSSSEAEEICIRENIKPEKLAICIQYTSESVSEALCLANNELSAESVIGCYVTDTVLEEQACLLGPDSGFFKSVQDIKDIRNEFDFAEYGKLVDSLKTEIKKILRSGSIIFDRHNDFFILIEDEEYRED